MTKSKIREGKIVQVIGPVVDIEFAEGDLPTIYNAVKLTNTRISDQEWNLGQRAAAVFPPVPPPHRCWCPAAG